MKLKLKLTECETLTPDEIEEARRDPTLALLYARIAKRRKEVKCCDADCAGANNCRVGGIRCAGCGWHYCAHDLDEECLCEDCARARELEREEEERDE